MLFVADEAFPLGPHLPIRAEVVLDIIATRRPE
jgi:hypothetical protein